MYISLIIRQRSIFRFTEYSVRSFKSVRESYYNNVNTIKMKMDSITLPERFKGTIVEKWSLYWKELYKDYYEVARETVTNARNNPSKTLFYFMIGSFLVYLNKSNPSEACFRDALLTASNDVILVSKPMRNPASDEHLIFVESCYNAGLIRKFNFGIFSVIWVDDYDKAVGLYKAHCSYLQPQYLSLYERIIDIGFMDRWWIIESKMKDYDINPNEWPSDL